MPIEPTVECVPCKKQNPIGSVSCFNCGFPLDPELAGVDPLSFAKTMTALRGIGPQVQDLKVVISISRGQDSFVSLWRKKCKNHLRKIWDHKIALRPHPKTIQERWDRDHWYRFQMMAQGWSRSFLAVVEAEALSPGDQSKKNVDFKTRQKWWGGKVEIRSCQTGGMQSQPRRQHDDYATYKKRSRFSQSGGEIHCREPSLLVHRKNATSSMILRSSSSPLSTYAVASAERRSSRRFSAGSALHAHNGTAFSVWTSHGTLHSGITSSA